MKDLEITMADTEAVVGVQKTAPEVKRPSLSELAQMGAETKRQDTASLISGVNQAVNLAWGFIRNEAVNAEIRSRVSETVQNAADQLDNGIHTVENKVHDKVNEAKDSTKSKFTEAVDGAKKRLSNWFSERVQGVAKTFSGAAERTITTYFKIDSGVDKVISETEAKAQELIGKPIKRAAVQFYGPVDATYDLFDSAAKLEKSKYFRGIGERARRTADRIDEVRDKVWELHEKGADRVRAAGRIREGLYSREQRRKDKLAGIARNMQSLKANPSEFLKS